MIIQKLKDKRIDILIPNMGAAKQDSWIMTLTLNSSMLKKILSELNPKVVLPVHFGTFQHYIEPVKKIAEINDWRIKIIGLGKKEKIEL